MAKVYYSCIHLHMFYKSNGSDAKPKLAARQEFCVGPRLGLEAKEGVFYLWCILVAAISMI